MSFIKMLSRLANLKYFLLVLSLMLIIPFTPLETHPIYGGDYINRISIPYRIGAVKALSFLTGFTLLPIIPSSHFPIISNAWSATYYVDARNGKDINNGLSPSSPWKTIAKINTSRFQPGDQILFKKGEVWREQLTPPSSGTYGSPIIYGAYGNGIKPSINGSDLMTTWTADFQPNIWSATTSVQPFVVFFGGMPGTKKSSKNELISPKDWHWTASTLYIYAPSNPNTYFNNPGIEACSRYYSVRVDTKVYLIFENLNITKGGNGTNSYQFGLKACADIILRDCDFSYGGSRHVAIWDNTGDVLIQRSTFTDTNMTNNSNEANSGIDIQGKNETFTVTAEFCTFADMDSTPNSWHHGHGVYVKNGKLIWRYNYHKGDSVYKAGSAVRIASATPCAVYYNLFTAINGMRYWGICLTGPISGTPHLVYNNVFHNCNYVILADTSDNRITVKNNIFYWDKGSTFKEVWHLTKGSANFTSDYNLFYNIAGNYIFTMGNTQLNSISDWKAASNQDAHSKNVDPKLKNPSAGDFNLLSSSPCIDAGTNVSLTSDYAGNIVSRGPAPDIGAFEYHLLP